MDMALGVLSEIHGVDFARQVAYTIEYRWNEDKDQDDFGYRNNILIEWKQFLKQ